MEISTKNVFHTCNQNAQSPVYSVEVHNLSNITHICLDILFRTNLGKVFSLITCIYDYIKGKCYGNDVIWSSDGYMCKKL